MKLSQKTQRMIWHRIQAEMQRANSRGDCNPLETLLTILDRFDVLSGVGKSHVSKMVQDGSTNTLCGKPVPSAELHTERDLQSRQLHIVFDIRFS